jgi:hypothetical protein
MVLISPTLMNCDIRDDLLRQKETALTAWYEAKARVEIMVAQRNAATLADAKRAAACGEQKVQHLQRAITAHYEKHRCNVD